MENIEDLIYESIETEAETFKIDDDNKASWALKIIHAENDEADRLIGIADSQIAELEEKKQAIRERLSHKTGYLTKLLFDYFGTVAHKETKTQESYKLLDGSLVWKKAAQKMVPDKEKLLEYVKANNMPEFVKVKEDIDWAAYKKECEIFEGSVVNAQTGDMLPADLIAVEEEPGSFTIKF